MSIDEEKKFVMKHTFIDVKNKKKEEKVYGKTEKRFSIPWRILIYSVDFSSSVGLHFECLKKMKGEDEWSIDATVEVKFLTDDGEKLIKGNRSFKPNDTLFYVSNLDPTDDYLIDGNLTMECHVTIHKMTGIEIPFLRSFEDESAMELSDVELKVKDQKFYVLKMYLAGHSTYFKSLFCGNFNESKQSEVELNDIDPYDFQKFLEVLYASPDINDDTVEGILKLSDMYDAKAATQQCEKFLVDNSKLSLKEKFLLAIQYKLDDLKKKCMPEFKTSEDIAAVIPEDPLQLDHAVWKDLLNLALSFNKN